MRPHQDVSDTGLVRTTTTHSRKLGWVVKRELAAPRPNAEVMNRGDGQFKARHEEMRLCVGNWNRDLTSVSYCVPGPENLAHLLLRQATFRSDTSLHEHFEFLGRTLAAIHEDLFRLTPVRDIPNALRRTEEATRNGCLQALARHSGLSIRDVRTVEECTFRVLSEFENTSRRLLHGSPTMRNQYLADDCERTGVLLVGEDLCLGPIEYDVGLVVGEVIEIHLSTGRPIQPNMIALLDCYGSAKIDVDRMRVMVAFQLISHAIDYYQYKGWNDMLKATLMTAKRYLEQH